MRRQTYPVANIANGMDVSRDPVFLLDTASPNLRGARIHKGLLKKDVDLSIPFGANVSNEYVMHFDNFYMESGSEYLVAASNQEVYFYDANSANFVGLGANLSSDLDHAFCSTSTVDANGNDTFIITNGKDAILKWDGNTAGNVANLGGMGNATAALAIPFMSRLILANITDGGTSMPRRIWWSKIGNPEDYTVANGGGAIEMLDTVDWITGLITIGDKLYIFKERSIWELVYIGGIKIFDPRLVIDGIGTYCGKSIISLGDAVIFFGPDNIYSFNGANVAPLGDQLQPLLYDTETRILNNFKLNRGCSVFVEELYEYWLALPTNGATIPNLILKLNLAANSWILRDKEVTAFGYYAGLEGTAWSALTNTWANATKIWMDKVLPSGAPTTLLGAANGAVFQDTRTSTSNDTMTFRTKSFTFGRSSRVLELRLQAKGGPFTVNYSLNEGVTFEGDTTFGYQANFTEYQLPINKTTQHFIAQIVTSANTFELKWMEPWYISRARSKSQQTT